MSGLRRFVRYRFTGIRRRLLDAVLSLPPVRRRLGRRAHAAWDAAGSITFVCFGNVCRSPFGEALAARRLGSSHRVTSAGTFHRSGRPSPDVAVSVARRWEVDLVPHRSRVLDAAMVEKAGPIFVFDVDDFRRVRRDFPQSRGRIHILGVVADRGALSIRDPYGRPPEVFARAYGRIADLIASYDGGGKEPGP